MSLSNNTKSSSSFSSTRRRIAQGENNVHSKHNTHDLTSNKTISRNKVASGRRMLHGRVMTMIISFMSAAGVIGLMLLFLGVYSFFPVLVFQLARQTPTPATASAALASSKTTESATNVLSVSPLRFGCHPRIVGDSCRRDASALPSVVTCQRWNHTAITTMKSKQNNRTHDESMIDNDNHHTTQLHLHARHQNQTCVPMHSWQKTLHPYPTCNHMHELDMTHLTNTNSVHFNESSSSSWTKMVFARGSYSLVWVLKTDHATRVAFKSLRWDLIPTTTTTTTTIKPPSTKTNHYTPQPHLDALLSERLSSSPYIVSMYAYCGNSGVYDLGYQGTLEDAMTRTNQNIKGRYVLRYALQMAFAVSHLHSVHTFHHPTTTNNNNNNNNNNTTNHTSPEPQQASVVHADLKPSQFVYINGTFQLNDFNMAQFLKVDETTKEVCGFDLEHHSRYRAPEECLHEPQNDKVDVYRLGHIFYYLLTQGKEPYFNISSNAKIREEIVRGRPPRLPTPTQVSYSAGNTTVDSHEEESRLKKHGKEVDVDVEVEGGVDVDVDAWAVDAVVKAMEMCYTRVARKRPSSREVARFLVKRYKALRRRPPTLKK